jgi:hypothetical protein
VKDREVDPRVFGWSRAAHDRRQAALGLELTPAERLAWLERALDELSRVAGRAETGVAVTDRGGANSGR